MENLFPEGYEEEVITADDVSEEAPVGYRNGFAFDSETGDFMRDGKNKILDSDGIGSWKSWCINCIQTERYHLLAYSTDFGIETALAMNAASREEAESILTREITEALLADPYERTSYVESVEFDWTAPDSVQIKVTAHGLDDVTIDLIAYILKGQV